MNKIIKSLSAPIKKLISSSIVELKLDEQKIKSKNEPVVFGEVIEIFFSNGIRVEVTTDDIPHFYGEGDLDFKFEEHNLSEIQIPNISCKRITHVKICSWRPKGIFVFKSDRYLVQIEFYHKEELILSVGLFYFDESTNKMECLITGELAINFNNYLSISDYKDHLYLDEVS